MPKNFAPDQRRLVLEFHEQGLNNVQIAEKMSERFPADWKTKYAHRSVARILKEFTNPSPSSFKTLDEMSREERAAYIEARLQTTPRFKLVFKHFSVDERNVFIDEYMSVIKSTETLTEVEEQSLFASVLELILALQALSRKECEEKNRDLTLAGEIPDTDPRFRRNVDPRYQNEYDQHMKLYQKGMEQLKMARKDRLKEVRSQKQTLLDLAESLSNKSIQAEAATEIERLSRIKDEELKRLLESGYLFGVFQE